MGLRKEWTGKAFIEKNFYKGINNNSPQVKEFERKLGLFPQDEDWITIATYGSLMNANDIPRTLGNEAYSQPGIMHGYQRVFNCGYKDTGSFLNIRKASSSDILISLITVKYDMIPNYIKREQLYEPVKVQCTDLNGEHVEAIAVIADEYTDIGLEPQLNYLHLCLTGIASLHGMTGVHDFLKSETYNSKLRKMSTIKEWLDNVDLIDLLIRQEYKSR